MISICTATRNKGEDLTRTLAGLAAQDCMDQCEVIVVDDNPDSLDTEQRCRSASIPQLKYIRVHRVSYGNPAYARNVAFWRAKGDIVVDLSSDVVVEDPTAISRLVSYVTRFNFVVATVWNRRKDGTIHMQYTGSENHRPFFFLGAIRREHLYAIGGYDPEFVYPAWDDNWYADCLMNGAPKLAPIWVDDVIGFHQDHQRKRDMVINERPSKELYGKKSMSGIWMSSTGPWVYVPGMSARDVTSVANPPTHDRSVATCE